MALLDDLIGSFAKPEVLEQLATTTGLDTEALGGGMGSMLGPVMDGLKGLAGTEEGLAKLGPAFDGADPALLDDPVAALNDPSGAFAKSGSDMLGGLFGEQGTNEIVAAAGSASGFGAGAIAKLLPLAMPFVMGFLKRTMAGQGVGLADLSAILEEQGGAGGFLQKIKDALS